MSEAFVSLTTNSEYAKGALVLGKSLRNTKTTKKLVLMVTTGVDQTVRKALLEVWDELVDVTLYDSNDQERLALIARPELGCTFSKLRAWTLTQFTKCVFLDADTLVIQNVDDLFEREELSAAPDIGWPDCFNTGVFVFRPSTKTYERLLLFAQTFGSFDGGDQGLLNEYFSSWSRKDISFHLPFLYNMVSNVSYTYAPAFQRYGADVKIVHFLGSVKPWHQSVDPSTGKVRMSVRSAGYSKADEDFNQMWWDLYKAVTVECGMTEMQYPSWEQWHEKRRAAGKLYDHCGAWEEGHPDYMGEDKFENIMAHMKSVILDDE